MIILTLKEPPPVPLETDMPSPDAIGTIVVGGPIGDYARMGFTIPCDEADGADQRYTGDAAVPGKGEVLVWKPRVS